MRCRSTLRGEQLQIKKAREVVDEGGSLTEVALQLVVIFRQDGEM